MPDEGDRQPREGRRARIRGRLLVASAVAAFVAASGAGLERGLGVTAPGAPGVSRSRTGAWLCPHGGSESWKGWVVVTNPGARVSRVRLTTFARRGVVARDSFAVAPAAQVYRSIPTPPGAATQVEYFGPPVGVASVVRSGDAATAATRCAAAGRRHWYLPDVTTREGETAQVVVMNPFAKAATFDVVMRTDRRPAIRPGPLSPFVLGPGRSTAIPVNRYVLQGPDERLVTAEVHVQIGRVVVGSLARAGSTIRGEIGSVAASTRWALPVSGDGGDSLVGLVNPGRRRADMTMILESRSAQRTAAGLGEASVPSDDVRAYVIEGEGPLGVVVESTNGTPVVVGRRVVGEEGDRATVGGSPGASGRWLVLPTEPPSGDPGLVVLQNPGEDRAEVDVRLLGPGVRAARRALRLTVGPGRVAIVDLGEAGAEGPVSALIEAGRGTVVAGAASYSSSSEGYGATLGIPLRGEA